MRLTQKKVQDILVSILGEEGMPLIDALSGKENVSEFDLATKIKKDIKIVRRMLYMLYNYNLVAFTRKKDKQKGWYVYYWTLLPDSIRFNYIKRRKELLESLKGQLLTEEKELFFVCPENCVRLTFDQGMDFEFHCPECGELISQDNSEGRIRGIKKTIDQIEKELSSIEQEKKKKAAQKAVKEEVKTVVKKKVVKGKVTKKKGVKKKVAKKKIVKKKSTAKTVKKKSTKKTVKKKKKKPALTNPGARKKSKVTRKKTTQKKSRKK
jgi:transcription initiation factor TFIIE subunit alpha